MCVDDLVVAKTASSLAGCEEHLSKVTDPKKKADKCMELDGQGTDAQWFTDWKKKIEPYCKSPKTPPEGPGGPGGGG